MLASAINMIRQAAMNNSDFARQIVDLGETLKQNVLHVTHAVQGQNAVVPNERVYPQVKSATQYLTNVLPREARSMKNRVMNMYADYTGQKFIPAPPPLPRDRQANYTPISMKTRNTTLNRALNQRRIYQQWRDETKVMNRDFSGFNRSLNSYSMELPEGYKFRESGFIEGLTEDIAPAIAAEMKEMTSNGKRMKVIIEFTLKMTSKNREDKFSKYSTGEVVLIQRNSNFLVIAKDYLEEMIDGIDEFLANNDKEYGNTFNHIAKVHMTAFEADDLSGGSFLPTPECLKKKARSITNIENKDNMCFLYSVLAGIYEGPTLRNKTRMSHYKDMHEAMLKNGTALKFEGIEFPVKCSRDVIQRFEEQNDISVNIYRVNKVKIEDEAEDGEITAYDYRVVLVTATKRKLSKHVDLLYITPLDDAELDTELSVDPAKVQGHYALIVNKNQLLSGQVRSSKVLLHFCSTCAKKFSSYQKLAEHEKTCDGSLQNYQLFVMPEPGRDKMFFKNFKNIQRCHIQAFADFEAALEPINVAISTDKDTNEVLSSHRQRHRAISYHIIVVNFHTKQILYDSYYMGQDAAVRFVNVELKHINQLANEYFGEKKERFPKKKAVVKKIEPVVEAKAEKDYLYDSEEEEPERSYTKPERVDASMDWFLRNGLEKFEQPKQRLVFERTSVSAIVTTSLLTKKADDSSTPLLERDLDFEAVMIVWDEGKRLYNVYNRSLITGPPVQHCHEVIIGHLPQKIRFDIDSKGEKLDFNIILALMRQIKTEWLIRYCLIDDGSNAPDELQLDDFTVFESCDEKKLIYSYHILVAPTKYAVANNQEAAAFCEFVVSKLPQKIYDLVDKNVYKSVQNFRMCDSSKASDPNRYKRILFPGKVAEYCETLIGHCEDLEILPLISDPKKANAVRNIVSADVNDKIVNRAVVEAEKQGFTQGLVMRDFKLNDQEYIPPNGGKVIRKSYYVNFKRVEPSFCNICNSVHEHDNSLWLHVNCYDEDIIRVYAKCRRNAENEKVQIYHGNYLHGNVLKTTIYMSEEQKKKHREATHCHICGDELSKSPKGAGDKHKNFKVRDHDHMTGEYRGPAHSWCNLQANLNGAHMPVWFHNLNYDMKHILDSLKDADWIEEDKINVIPNNSESIKTLTIDRLDFKDTMAFMANSLDNLTKLFYQSNGKFEFSQQYFNKLRETNKKLTAEDANLFYRKGIYPYNYMTGVDKMAATQLPPIEEFEEDCRPCKRADYLFAQYMWDKLGCKTFADYHEYYNRADVYCLADVFGGFCDKLYSIYKIDPAQYISVPAFAWDAMLKYTGITLDLITDEHMYKMLDNIRGGITQSVTRYARANNPYIPQEAQDKLKRWVEEDKRTSYINYQDCNNLYGSAMCQKLPCGSFRWMDAEKLKNITSQVDEQGFIKKEAIKSLNSCFVKFDLHVPNDPALHDYLRDLPPAPSNKAIKPEMYSATQLANGVNPKANDRKLITDLADKDDYVCHYTMLHQIVDLGLKVKRIHAVIEFEESAWLKPYIDVNTHYRKLAKESGNDFEQDLFKLLNNSVFGKTMEDVRSHMNFKMLRNSNDSKSVRKCINLTNSPTFKSFMPFSEGAWVGFMMNKEKVCLNKPVYCGLSILDISKNMMYDFWYNKLKPAYRDDVKLCYMDTDSFVYQVYTEDYYADMLNHVDENGRSWYDCSKYSKESALYQKTKQNHGEYGFFKDEMDGRPIIEFVAPRAKVYSYAVYGSKKKSEFEYSHAEFEKYKAANQDRIRQDAKTPPEYSGDIEVGRKCKGVKKSVVKTNMRHDEMIDAMINRKTVKKEVWGFKSKNYELTTVFSTKVAMNAADTKRWTAADQINTYPYGHYKTYSS